MTQDECPSRFKLWGQHYMARPAQLHASAALAPYCLKNFDADAAGQKLENLSKGGMVWERARSSRREGWGPAGGCAGPKLRVGISKRIVVRSSKSFQVQKKCNEVQKKCFPFFTSAMSNRNYVCGLLAFHIAFSCAFLNCCKDLSEPRYLAPIFQRTVLHGACEAQSRTIRHCTSGCSGSMCKFLGWNDTCCLELWLAESGFLVCINQLQAGTLQHEKSYLAATWKWLSQRQVEAAKTEANLSQF